MPWLDQGAVFDPDLQATPVCGIASRMTRHDSGLHNHDRGQLLFTYSGSLRITSPSMLAMLPPGRVAWIPPGTPHRVQIRAEVEYRSIYLDAIHSQLLSENLTILSITPLLREVFERISRAPLDTCWGDGAAAHLLAICLDELKVAHHEAMVLPIPRDKRMRTINLDTVPPDLCSLSSQIGLSSRTVTRIFKRETGMTYQVWRQSWRFLRAIDLLVSGQRSSQVAFDLDFASDSAFIAFFRQMTGTTPVKYVREG